MLLPRPPASFAAFLVLASTLPAQVTIDALLVGGPGAQSSHGFDDPALLSDGATAASARLVFTLDRATATLHVEVTNTSPVVAGVPNPLLKRVFFNAPAAITGMTLVTQSSSGGVAPDFTLDFATQPELPANPSKGERFGSFHVGLTDPLDAQGTLANAAADTYALPPAQLALGPCTFDLALTGDLTGLTADSFTALYSVLPPGTRPSQAVARFEEGGPGAASAFVNEGDFCVCTGLSLRLDPGCGATLDVTPPPPGGYSTVTYDGTQVAGLVAILHSLPDGPPIPFRGCFLYLRPGARLLGVYPADANGDHQLSFPVPATHLCTDEVTLQAFGLDPFTRRIAEISNGVLVAMGD